MNYDRTLDVLSREAETRVMVLRGIVAAVLASLAFGVCLGSAVAGADPRFSAPVLRKDARSVDPVGPVAADLNGDGKPDLATADENRVSVLVGKGDGSFRKPVAYRTTVEAWDIAVADANGDGPPDLIVAGNDPKQYVVTVLVNDGAGRFRPDRVYAVGRSDANGSAVAAGDVNGDGIVDVVVTNGFVGDLAVLLGTGGGHLAPTRAIPGRGGSDVALADFNGDERLDVALASYGKRQVTVRLGNGDGTFGPAQSFGAGANDSAGVTVADLNQDGKLDLAVPRGRLVLYFGNGDGTFGSQSVYASGGPAVVADFNSDGNPDIAQFLGGFRVTVRSGNGDGTFDSRRQPLGFRIYALYIAGGTVADFNGDARPDLVSLAYNDQGEFGGQSVGTEVLLNWTGLPAPPCVVVPVTHLRVVVPVTTHLRLRAATREIQRAGCRLGHVSYRYSRKVRKNRVISQRPHYGAVLPSHARVHLVVSRGRRR